MPDSGGENDLTSHQLWLRDLCSTRPPKFIWVQKEAQAYFLLISQHFFISIGRFPLIMVVQNSKKFKTHFLQKNEKFYNSIELTIDNLYQNIVALEELFLKI